jgi:hypothetical protein
VLKCRMARMGNGQRRIAKRLPIIFANTVSSCILHNVFLVI